MPKKPAPVSYRALKATPRRAPIQSDNRWYWQVYYNHDGAQHTVNGAPSGRYTPRQIKALLRRAFDAGDWATHNDGPETSTDTARDRVSDLLDDFLDHTRDRHTRGSIADLTLTAAETWHKRLSQYPDLLALPITRAPSLRVLQRHADTVAADYAPATAQRTWKYLREAWQWGRTYYPEVVSDDLPRVELPANTKEQGYTPTTEELLSVRDQLSGELRRAYVCLMATGARVHEIGRLDWSRVRWDRETVTLLGKGKGGGRKVPRLIPMMPTLRDALREQWVARGQPAHGRVWELADVGKALRRRLPGICEALGVPVHTPHGIRRWMSCELVERVFSPTPFSAADYEAWMGHTLQMGLRTYASARPGRLEGAAEAVEALLAPNVIELNERRG